MVTIMGYLFSMSSLALLRYLAMVLVLWGVELMVLELLDILGSL